MLIFGLTRDQLSKFNGSEQRGILEKALKDLGVLEHAHLQINQLQRGEAETVGLNLISFVGVNGIELMLQDHPQGVRYNAVLSTKKQGSTGKWLMEELGKLLPKGKVSEESATPRESALVSEPVRPPVAEPAARVAKSEPPANPGDPRRFPGSGFSQNPEAVAAFMHEIGRRYPAGIVKKADILEVIELVADTSRSYKILNGLENHGHLRFQGNDTYRVQSAANGAGPGIPATPAPKAPPAVSTQPVRSVGNGAASPGPPAPPAAATRAPLPASPNELLTELSRRVGRLEQTADLLLRVVLGESKIKLARLRKDAAKLGVEINGLEGVIKESESLSAPAPK